MLSLQLQHLLSWRLLLVLVRTLLVLGADVVELSLQHAQLVSYCFKMLLELKSWLLMLRLEVMRWHHLYWSWQLIRRLVQALHELARIREEGGSDHTVIRVLWRTISPGIHGLVNIGAILQVLLGLRCHNLHHSE